MSDYQYFITPFNISWKSENLPKEILDSSDFIKWKNGLFDDEASLRWSPIHVTSKTLSEIIIQEKSGGTGGLNSILLIKKMVSGRN